MFAEQQKNRIKNYTKEQRDRYLQLKKIYWSEHKEKYNKIKRERYAERKKNA